MSIKGLWKILKRFVRDGHLSQFRGQRVAVDMYVWLHRAIIGSVTVNTEKLLPYLKAKLVDGDTTATITLDDVLVVTDQYLVSMMEKVHHLQRFGIVPVCVFDGTEMPMKQGTDEERQARRESAFSKAMQFFEDAYSVEHATLRSPSHSLSEGIRELERAVDISPEMAHTVIQLLREEHHVECLVAPYEADAQLSYLCREGHVQAVLSEDSDLIAYFCPCVISKLDKTGRCDVIRPPEAIPAFFADLTAQSQLKPRRGTNTPAVTLNPLAGSGMRPSSPATSTSVASPTFSSPVMAAPQSSGSGYTYESFLLGCVLSGCDYVRSLRGIGATKAFRLVSQSHSLTQLMRTLHEEYGFPTEELHQYRHQILSAFYCFAHHIVYCPRQQRLALFHPLPNLPGPQGGQAGVVKPVLKQDLVGYLWPDDVARKVCEACLYDPSTHRLYCGLFQRCVDQYMKRTRQGQASLRHFSGFEALSSAKVVIRKRERTQGAEEQAGTVSAVRVKLESSGESQGEAEAFSQPLRRVGQTTGFLGSTPAAHATAGATVSRALVRSKYFLRRTAVIDTSDLDSDEENDAEEGSTRGDGESLRPAASTCTSQAAFTSLVSRPHTCGQTDPALSEARSTDTNTLDASDATATTTTAAATASSRAVTRHTSSEGGACSSDSLVLGQPETVSPPAFVHAGLHTRAQTSSPSVENTIVTTAADVPPSQKDSPRKSVPSPLQMAATAATHSTEQETAVCACPFGYWQCNTAHSIFVQCFQGKAWVRGEAPPPSTSSAAVRCARPVKADALATSDSEETEDDVSPTKADIAASSTTRHTTAPPCATRAVHVLGAFRPPRALARPTSPDDLVDAHSGDTDGMSTACPLDWLDENVDRHTAPSTHRKAAPSDAKRLFERLAFSRP